MSAFINQEFSLSSPLLFSLFSLYHHRIIIYKMFNTSNILFIWCRKQWLRFKFSIPSKYLHWWFSAVALKCAPACLQETSFLCTSIHKRWWWRESQNEQQSMRDKDFGWWWWVFSLHFWNFFNIKWIHSHHKNSISLLQRFFVIILIFLLLLIQI